jgi:hypothetical protein
VTTKTDAESEVHNGPVQLEVASLAVNELSKEPKLRPVTEIKVAPKTGPLVMATEDAVGASNSNATVLELNCKPTETVIDPKRVRPEDDLLKIVDDERQREASSAEPANFEKVDTSEVEKPRPITETSTAPLIGTLLQLVQLETSFTTDGAVYESINGDTPNNGPTDTLTPRAELLPTDAFPIRDDEEIQVDCSTAVPPNEIQLEA